MDEAFVFTVVFVDDFTDDLDDDDELLFCEEDDEEDDLELGFEVVVLDFFDVVEDVFSVDFDGAIPSEIFLSTQRIPQSVPFSLAKTLPL